MFGIFNVKEELKIVLKVMNQQIRMSADAYNHKINSMADRATITEKRLGNLERDGRETKDDVREIKDDVREIKEMLSILIAPKVTAR